MTLKRLIPVLLLAFLCGLVPPETATAEDDQRESLRGIKELSVTVNIDPDAQQRGLGKNRLRGMIESRLRQAGIQVTGVEGTDVAGGSHLCFTINTSAAESGWRDLGLCACSINVQVYQEVVLIRSGETPKRNFGSTWYVNYTAMIGKRNIQDLEAKVIEVTDVFIKDFLASNAKK